MGKSNYFKTEKNGINVIHRLLDKKISYTDKFEDYNQNKELFKLPLISGEC